MWQVAVYHIINNTEAANEEKWKDILAFCKENWVALEAALKNRHSKM